MFASSAQYFAQYKHCFQPHSQTFRRLHKWIWEFKRGKMYFSNINTTKPPQRQRKQHSERVIFSFFGIDPDAVRRMTISTRKVYKKTHFSHMLVWLRLVVRRRANKPRLSGCWIRYCPIGLCSVVAKWNRSIKINKPLLYGDRLKSHPHCLCLHFACNTDWWIYSFANRNMFMANRVDSGCGVAGFCVFVDHFWSHLWWLVARGEGIVGGPALKLYAQILMSFEGVLWAVSKYSKPSP